MPNRTILDEIQEALERATPGPWSWDAGDIGEQYSVPYSGVCDTNGESVAEAEPDEAVLIALLRNHANPLLAVVRAATAAEKILPKDDESRYQFSEAVRLAMDLRRTLRTLDPRLLGES